MAAAISPTVLMMFLAGLTLLALSTRADGQKVKELPDDSICSDICPGCEEPTCTCPKKACWPGKSLTDTADRSCNCFASLGFCKEGEAPIYADGAECPTCWPADNKACMCFAVLSFCDSKEFEEAMAKEQKKEDEKKKEEKKPEKKPEEKEEEKAEISEELTLATEKEPEDASPGFFTEIQHLLGFVFLVGTVASGAFFLKRGRSLSLENLNGRIEEGFLGTQPFLSNEQERHYVTVVS